MGRRILNPQQVFGKRFAEPSVNLADRVCGNRTSAFPQDKRFHQAGLLAPVLRRLYGRFIVRVILSHKPIYFI